MLTQDSLLLFFTSIHIQYKMCKMMISSGEKEESEYAISPSLFYSLGFQLTYLKKKQKNQVSRHVYLLSVL